MRFEGIYTPIITPLDEKERVDESGLSKQINRLVEHGIHGIYLLGSSGEFVSLSDADRRFAIETTVATVSGRVPIICGAMDASTSRVITNIEAAQELGVTAVATTPPYYYPSSDQELKSFYRQVAQSTDLPVVIYNIPIMVKTNIDPEIVVEIADDSKNIAGIKDSTADWTIFSKLQAYLGDRDDFSILLGSYTMAGAAIAFGAEGAVISIANIDPKATVALYQAAKVRDLDTVQRLQRKLLDLGQLYRYGNGVSCLKACAEILGICADHTTYPLHQVSAQAKMELTALLRSHQLC